jgi:hypothetical protein
MTLSHHSGLPGRTWQEGGSNVSTKHPVYTLLKRQRRQGQPPQPSKATADFHPAGPQGMPNYSTQEQLHPQSPGRRTTIRSASQASADNQNKLGPTGAPIKAAGPVAEASVAQRRPGRQHLPSHCSITSHQSATTISHQTTTSHCSNTSHQSANTNGHQTTHSQYSDTSDQAESTSPGFSDQLL